MKYFAIQLIIGATVILTKGLKISINSTTKAFSRLSAINSCTRDIAHSMESATM
jgi:hypothetical protein